MIDGNLWQTTQRSFDFEGRVAVKLTVSFQTEMFNNEIHDLSSNKFIF